MAKFSDSKILFWLSLPTLTPRKQTELIKKAGSLGSLWHDFKANSTLIKDSVGEKAYAELLRYHDEDYIETQLDKLRSSDIFVVTVLNPIFPQTLLQPEVDAPLVMYYRGDINAIADTCVAVVGTRACTAYGKDMAKDIASDLAVGGVTVVSGLATGIDTYAHTGAMDAGGKTIAVMGSGFNHITPVDNVKLCDKIIQNGGLVLTEYKPDMNATKFTFPARNRIISGLSRGVVVVEAGEKSGALITAKYALEQNREVFALPGNVTSSRSKGCNDLLYEGANFIRNGRDVLERLNVVPPKKANKEQENCEIIVDKDQKKLYILLEEGTKTYDELVVESGMSPAKLSEALLMLELEGAIVRTSANTFEVRK
ncbi:MAG: DNA-processing protein DprA [Clostridia bacterium]|nr:DNA-processing protein DprA [Clostridia bacterium]